MKEHERKDYERLRAEDRWPEASEFREAERKRLRTAGRNRQQACDESWALMLRKYPPQKQDNPRLLKAKPGRIAPVNTGIYIQHTEAERRELAELAQAPGAWDDSWNEALSWANTHCEQTVMPSKARSIIAWLLLKLARTDDIRFESVYCEDYALRHGLQLFWAPPGNRREEQIEDQLEQDLLYERALARLDAADQQLGKSPTIAETLHNAEPDSEESTEAIHQLITRLATEYNWQPQAHTDNAAKS